MLRPGRRALEGLTAIHDGSQFTDHRLRLAPIRADLSQSGRHPVVATHPRTGRKHLYVSAAFTTHIPVQLTRGESDACSGCCSATSSAACFQTRIRWHRIPCWYWTAGAGQHPAIWDYYPFERWGEGASRWW